MLKPRMPKKLPKPRASSIPALSSSPNTLKGSEPASTRPPRRSTTPPRVSNPASVRPANDWHNWAERLTEKNWPSYPSWIQLRLSRLALPRSINVLLHRFFLALDRFDQLELGAAPVQVMRGPMDSEIGISAQKIR